MNSNFKPKASPSQAVVIPFPGGASRRVGAMRSATLGKKRVTMDFVFKIRGDPRIAGDRPFHKASDEASRDF